MTTYTVTEQNYNSAAFWSAINESATGHTLDFTDLPSLFSISFDALNGLLSIFDGTSTYTVGEPGASGVDATLGGTTTFELLSIVGGSGGDDVIEVGAGDDTIVGSAGSDDIDGGAGTDTYQAGTGTVSSYQFNGICLLYTSPSPRDA